MKVTFFDKNIKRTFYGILSAISVITSIAFLFVEIKKQDKFIFGISALILVGILYVILWIYANFRQSIHLKINTSDVEIKYGNIFLEEADFKVIAFNEYFDTLVDDKIIAKSTLNGKFINEIMRISTDELDDIISSDDHLQNCIKGNDIDRKVGKKIKYKLGSICVVKSYLITAMTHFDCDNRAYLYMSDYINFLLNFWNEVDRVYAGKTVALPVLGSGITRFKGYEHIPDQELLELIIWTFKVSRVKFAYPSKVKIVVYQNKSDKTCLHKLKDLETA